MMMFTTIQGVRRHEIIPVNDMKCENTSPECQVEKKLIKFLFPISHDG